MRGRGEDADVGVCGDGAFPAVDGERLWLVADAFRDRYHGGDEAEFFGEDGAGHAVEELREVGFVVCGRRRAVVREKAVEVGLEGELGGGVECEVDD